MKKIIASTIIAMSIFAAGVVYSAEDAATAPGAKKAQSANEMSQQPQQVKVVPKKVEVDSNFDGKVDRTEIYDANGQVTSVEIDSSGDGKIDEWIIYENGKPVQNQRDSNGDGKVDVWIEY